MGGIDYKTLALARKYADEVAAGGGSGSVDTDEVNSLIENYIQFQNIEIENLLIGTFTFLENGTDSYGNEYNSYVYSKPTLKYNFKSSYSEEDINNILQFLNKYSTEDNVLIFESSEAKNTKYYLDIFKTGSSKSPKINFEISEINTNIGDYGVLYSFISTTDASQQAWSFTDVGGSSSKLLDSAPSNFFSISSCITYNESDKSILDEMIKELIPLLFESCEVDKECHLIIPYYTNFNASNNGAYTGDYPVMYKFKSSYNYSDCEAIINQAMEDNATMASSTETMFILGVDSNNNIFGLLKANDANEYTIITQGDEIYYQYTCNPTSTENTSNIWIDVNNQNAIVTEDIWTGGVNSIFTMSTDKATPLIHLKDYFDFFFDSSDYCVKEETDTDEEEQPML